MKSLPIIKQPSNYFRQTIHQLLSIIKLDMSIGFSTDDYVPPPWSAIPQFSSYFEVIKNGDLIGEVPIRKKAFNLVGRIEDLCDLHIDNSSVSRKHAIIQFKQNEHCPYIYDLGGTHGTEVNRHKLPARAYQQIRPFDSIKFGVSSRVYLFRCPQFESLREEEEDKEVHNFMEILAEDKNKLNKQEMKQKYLDMLENDPTHRAHNQARSLMGSSQQTENYSGIDWGISDEREVYAYRSENQFEIEPDILRRLPGLDNNMLNKIAEHENNFMKHQEVSNQLNELANREKKEFGLEEKLRDKKEKLQRKFVEASEAMEKTEQWIHVHIFGEEEQKGGKKFKKVKEADSFEDDEFFDRTLSVKKDPNELTKRQKGQKEGKQSSPFTTKDFWKLEKQLKDKLCKLAQFEELLSGEKKELEQAEKKAIKQGQGEGNQDDDDELEKYMNENNEILDQNNKEIYSQRISCLQEEIKEIKQILETSIGSKEVNKIEREIKGIVDPQDLELEKMRKQKINKKKISETLSKLERIQEEAEEFDEEDINIFDYYRDAEQERKKHTNQRKRQRPQKIDEEEREFEKTHKIRPLQRIVRDQNQANEEGEEYFDLTILK